MKTKSGVGNIEIRDVSEPKVETGQVMIEVKAAGICGTDIHIYHDTFRSNPPVILGHEFSGIVKKVGAGVTEFKPGDRVTSETAAHVCGKCRFCRTGHYNLCPERLGLGYGVDGAFTKYCVVRKELVHFLPDSVDFRTGAMCEPLSCVVHGVIEQTGVHAGDMVVVLGPGSIGLIAAQVAMSEGGTVIVLGIDSDIDKFAIAEKLGCKRTINISKEDPLRIIKDLSDGYGADVVLECSGTAPAARLGFQLSSKRGRYCQMGLFGKPIEIDLEQIAYKELKVSGFISQKWTAWQTALRLLKERKVNLEPLISQELPLEDWKFGFESKEKGSVLKTILYPTE